MDQNHATDLAGLALDVDAASISLGHPQFEAEDAVFVRDARFSLWRNANRVTRIRARTPAAIARLFDRAEHEYGSVPHRRFDVDFRTPPEFEARLILDGYERGDTLVLLLDGDLIGTPAPCDIRPAESASDRRAQEELIRLNLEEHERIAGRASAEDLTMEKVAAERNQTPPFRYWLAWVDGAPRAYFASWRGLGDMGQVENLFTHPDYRHKGLATALIHHCVADCRSMGAGPVVIAAAAADTPKRMYAAMGFRPVAIARQYWRSVDPAS